MTVSTVGSVCERRFLSILVAVLSVAFALLLAVALAQAIHAAAVGAEIAHLGKARDGASLEHDRGCQRLADARRCLEQLEFPSQAHALAQPPLQCFDLLSQRLAHRAVSFHG